MLRPPVFSTKYLLPVDDQCYFVRYQQNQIALDSRRRPRGICIVRDGEISQTWANAASMSSVV